MNTLNLTQEWDKTFPKSACEKLPEPPREEQYGSLDELKSFLKAGNGDVSVTLSL